MQLQTGVAQAGAAGRSLDYGSVSGRDRLRGLRRDLQMLGKSLQSFNRGIIGGASFWKISALPIIERKPLRQLVNGINSSPMTAAHGEGGVVVSDLHWLV